MKKVWWAVTVILLSAAALTAYVILAPGKIRVALDSPVITSSVYDPSEMDAARLYFEEHPDSRMELISRHYDFDPSKSPLGFIEEKAAGTQFFVTTQPSSTLVESRSLFEGPDALLINTSATSPVFSGRDDFIIRTIQDAKQEQVVIADFVNGLPGQRLLVLQDDSNAAYTQPAFDYFAQIINAKGQWQITRQAFTIEKFRPADFKQLMAQPFDAMYVLAGDFQASIGNLIQLFHRFHPDAPIILTPWARSPAIFQSSGNAIDNLVMLSHFPAKTQDPAIGDFLKRFEARFGYQPMAMALKVRQALEALEQAFSLGHTTPESVKTYLINQRQINTSLGPLAFDQFGDTNRGLYPIHDLKQELR
jgi:branched-chain amino acid transport system substrate-binding protein